MKIDMYNLYTKPCTYRHVITSILHLEGNIDIV